MPHMQSICQSNLPETYPACVHISYSLNDSTPPLATTQQSPNYCFSFCSALRIWQPTPVFLPGESHGQRSLQATVHEVTRVGHNIVTKPPPLTLLHTKAEGNLITSDRVLWLSNFLSLQWLFISIKLKYKWLPLAYKPGKVSSAYLSHLSPAHLLSFFHSGPSPFFKPTLGLLAGPLKVM